MYVAHRLSWSYVGGHHLTVIDIRYTIAILKLRSFVDMYLPSITLLLLICNLSHVIICNVYYNKTGDLFGNITEFEDVEGSPAGSCDPLSPSNEVILPYIFLDSGYFVFRSYCLMI